MSFIRSLSNPEGLYIFGGMDGIEIATGNGWKLSNIGPDNPSMVVPYDAFIKVCEDWDQNADSAEADGFFAGEQHIWADTGELVDPETDPIQQWFTGNRRESRYAIKLSYGDKFCFLWSVTWQYVVAKALHDKTHCAAMDELETLKRDYISCRDALAEALNWHDNPEDPDLPPLTIPADRCQALVKKLDEATVIADRLADELADDDDVNDEEDESD